MNVYYPQKRINNMQKFILTIDQGTTSSRAILFDKKSHIFAEFQKEVHCFYPKPGWVETDAEEIYKSVIECIKGVLKQSSTSFDDIDSVAITNQRETTVIWNKDTCKPISRAIVWQSRQTNNICKCYKNKIKTIHKKTGLILNPYFSASKIRFILDHSKNAQHLAEEGKLLFGTIDSWLIYKLTGGVVHATDVTNASRTMLFNLKDLCWDEELCSLFNIPMKMLPKIKECSDDYGIINNNDLKTELHITGVIGDQQASLFGHTCFKTGDCKNTYGTGCFMLMNVGNEPILSKKGLLTTVAWKLNGIVTYALEGSVFIGGAAIQWLRDGLKIIKDASESEKRALKAENTENLYVVPAFVGLGTPYWDDDARGSILGITRSTSDNQIIKATLEGIAYQCQDVFLAMEQETHISLNEIQVDGGASKNNYLMQFQSDICQKDIMIPQVFETTALGAAYVAGLFTGFFSNLNAIKLTHNYSSIFNPSIDKLEANKKYKGWKKAIKATLNFE